MAFIFSRRRQSRRKQKLFLPLREQAWRLSSRGCALRRRLHCRRHQPLHRLLLLCQRMRSLRRRRRRRRGLLHCVETAAAAALIVVVVDLAVVCCISPRCVLLRRSAFCLILALAWIYMCLFFFFEHLKEIHWRKSKNDVGLFYDEFFSRLDYFFSHCARRPPPPKPK